MNINNLISRIKGISDKRAEVLKQELGIKTIADLLDFFPSRYSDRSEILSIKNLKETNREVQLIGTLKALREIKTGARKKRLMAILDDGTDEVDLIWFKYNKWYYETLFSFQNKQVRVYGKPSQFNHQINLVHPEVELYKQNETAKTEIAATYPSTEGLKKNKITNRFFSKSYQELFNSKPIIEENLSEIILSENKLMSRPQAYQAIHLPKNSLEIKKARYRLKFEELFFLHLKMLHRKIHQKLKFRSQAFTTVGANFLDFYTHHLPFELTQAQKRVIKEIRSDLANEAQMNRLLQGDVGSGKTIVALLIALIAKDNGFQSCLLAPTEILAQQHFNSFQDLLKNSDYLVELLTGSTPNSKRKTLFEDLKSGKIDCLIGTHALLEDNVKFKSLGLAIIDEQHRFGVEQRSRLWRKSNKPPHVLVMTATPIPRTLAMTLHGDLDYSVIDELPAGRKPIRTFHKTDKDRLELFSFVKKEIAKGRQVYFVYPLIEESETLEFKDLMDGYEAINRAFPSPDYQIGIVHGRMKSENKDYEMQRFAKGETQIMVATTVIEVGVNVPNASVMVIESAEKFGLSQLHQLRGRVGRGAEQSYCILMTKDSLNPIAYKRIKTMCETQDGFKIAEVDLELRGQGDIFGKQQSGKVELKIADLKEDKIIVEKSKYAAEQLIKNDSQLIKPENQMIVNYFNKFYKNRLFWGKIS